MSIDPSPEFEREQAASVIRREEELDVGRRSVQAGSLRIHKDVGVIGVDESLPRGIEHADVERLDPSEGDSGQIETLADGSVSIPVFEEELVVTKRLRVRERVVIRKRTVTEQQAIRTDLRRERVDVEADDGVISDEAETAEEGGGGTTST